MLHITNTEMSRSGVTLNSNAATSSSNSTASTGFSLTDFENELAALVNEALQAAGVSPSEASFSFTPTSSNSSTTSNSSTPTSSSAPTSNTPSQTNGATGNDQSNTTPDWINMPMIGEVNINAPGTPETGPTPSTLTSSGLPVDLTDSTDPVVGTEGLIYDPKNGVFGGMGAAPITDASTLTNPVTGQVVSTDLVLDGYEKIYGSDSVSLEGALMQSWGPGAVQAYLQANPQASTPTLQQETQQTQTNFEMYGPWTSFVDPNTGVLSYFDANGIQYADGTGPASQMFTAVGTPNTAAWDSATAL